MNRWEIILGIVLGLLVNEVTDISPWIARKLVHWSAYRWTTDPATAAGYAEEWAALIDERPGKLLKLLTATRFTLGAAGRAVPRIAKNGTKTARLTSRRIKARLAAINSPWNKPREMEMIVPHDLLTKGTDLKHLAEHIKIAHEQRHRPDLVMKTQDGRSLIIHMKATRKRNRFWHRFK
ncbi:hypothetical protein C1I93_09135 [Micromonospora endophytica]|uniref:Uncharacterized protein n=1 Tax=Micromonospora endophytica TaxID=515350 RepID=A0A2W2CFZ6_9ACTN|nr:hypothetical protein [Micromonospora endophytica]PZF98325.1 hypothetical protein C1I93_09135 [Micromonospora endophytica]BCJ61564.1 hypothetical protein Jiend_49860 [Micromonospora endophytica]